MTRIDVTRRPVTYDRPPPRHPARSHRRRQGGMTTGRMVGIGIGVLAAIVIAADIPDLVRYIWMTRM